MKATSYGKYDVFDDEPTLTWEEAESRALAARGKTDTLRKTEHPVATEVKENPPAPVEEVSNAVANVKPPELHILDRALILLIHLRERFLNEHPDVVSWVNEILKEAREHKEDIIQAREKKHRAD